MRDQYDARLWQDSHDDISRSADHFLLRVMRGVMQAFRVLHCIEWRAPWAEERDGKHPCQS